MSRSLRDEEKLRGLDACKDFVQTADGGPSFLKSIITGDELWCFQYDGETKRHSAEWQSHSSPRAEKDAFTDITHQSHADHIIWL